MGVYLCKLIDKQIVREKIGNRDRVGYYSHPILPCGFIRWVNG